MRRDSFKSAQHSLNYKMLKLQRLNKKQPVKVYTKQELEEFATRVGMEVSQKDAK